MDYDEGSYHPNLATVRLNHLRSLIFSCHGQAVTVKQEACSLCLFYPGFSRVGNYSPPLARKWVG